MFPVPGSLRGRVPMSADTLRTVTARPLTTPLTHALSIFRRVIRHMDRPAIDAAASRPRSAVHVAGNWNGSTGGSRDAHREARET